MVTQVGKFIEQQRLQQCLSRSELAARAGYENLSKGSNRICGLERNGAFDDEFLSKVINALDLERGHVETLIEADRQAELRAWEEWADQPIEPHLIIKLPGACAHKKLPDGIDTFEQGIEFLKSFCIERRTRACLVWSRRRRAWGRPDGTGWTETVTADDSGGPGMSLPGSKQRFVLAGS